MGSCRRPKKKLITDMLSVKKGDKTYSIYKMLCVRGGVEIIWIQNSDGEGMEISEGQFFDFIDKFFNNKL